MTKTVVTVEYNETTDEYELPLSDELLESVGWREGDTLIWIDNEDGTFTLKKADD